MEEQKSADTSVSQEKPVAAPAAGAPVPEEKPAPKKEKRGLVEMVEEMVEKSLPPRLNQTHLRPSDQQRLTELHELAQDVLKAVKKR